MIVGLYADKRLRYARNLFGLGSIMLISSFIFLGFMPTDFIASSRFMYYYVGFLVYGGLVSFILAVILFIFALSIKPRKGRGK